MAIRVKIDTRNDVSKKKDNKVTVCCELLCGQMGLIYRQGRLRQRFLCCVEFYINTSRDVRSLLIAIRWHVVSLRCARLSLRVCTSCQTKLANEACLPNSGFSSVWSPLRPNNDWKSEMKNSELWTLQRRKHSTSLQCLLNVNLQQMNRFPTTRPRKDNWGWSKCRYPARALHCRLLAVRSALLSVIVQR